MMMVTPTALISPYAGHKKIIILCRYPKEMVGVKKRVESVAGV